MVRKNGGIVDIDSRGQATRIYARDYDTKPATVRSADGLR
jgi:hypothetical protein